MNRRQCGIFLLFLPLNLAGQFSQAVFHTEIAVVQLSKPSFHMLGLSFRKAACQVKTGGVHLVSSLRVMRGLKGQIGTNTMGGGRRKVCWREVEPVIYATKTPFYIP